MSVFNYVILLKEKDQETISNYIRKAKLTAYVFSVNNDWVGITLDDLPQKGSEHAKIFSMHFHTYSFNFFDAEDHGWQYELFFDGEIKGGLEVNYEALSITDITKANMSCLKQIALNIDSISKLEKIIRECTSEPEELLGSVKHFNEGFEFISFPRVSFDYFANLTQLQREQINVYYVGNTKKKSNIEKVITEELIGPLKELGYNYIQRNEEHTFVREESGFEYGLIIEKVDKKRIEPKLFTPIFKGINMYYAQDGSRKEFDYTNETELRQCIKEIKHAFLKKADTWLKENRIELFNADELYRLIVDEFMKEYSYFRVKTDEDILFGGELVYEGAEGMVIFKHYPHSARLSTLVTVNGELTRLNQYLFDNGKISRSDLLKIPSAFRNEEEFIRTLKSALGLLQVYFFDYLKK